jgi:hypothetical protein
VAAGRTQAASTPTATTAPTTPTATARTTRSPPKPAMMRAPPLLHQVAAGRTQTTATTALVRPSLTPPRTSCPTATLLRAPLLTGLLCCGIASVHSSCCTTVACMHPPQPQPHHLMHVRARFPCRISSCWREQPHAALPSHSCPLLPECGKRACAQACKRWTSSWAPWLASVRPSARGRKSTEGGTPNAPARGSTTLVPLLTCITARTGRICWATLNSLTAPTNLLCSSWRTRSAPQDTSQRRTCSRALKIFESTTT